MWCDDDFLNRYTPCHTNPTRRGSSDTDDSSAAYLAFIDGALAALLAPVLCCLYALERDLHVYRVLRRTGQRVGRWCLGGGKQGRGERAA